MELKTPITFFGDEKVPVNWHLSPADLNAKYPEIHTFLKNIF